MSPTATDWDGYYLRPFPAASWTRRVTIRLLLRSLRRFAPTPLRTIVELGGGNSSFAAPLIRAFRPQRYHVVDRNELGLELALKRVGGDRRVCIHQLDILEPEALPQGDIVFSVGVIEHFSPEEMERAIQAHFDAARPGAIVLVAFPVPSLPYRVARRAAEACGCWGFPDERPLPIRGVVRSVRRHATILDVAMNWSIVFTQGIVTAKSGGGNLRPRFRSPRDA
ncbi:MAG: class I SAM-dependent methyltransferase [Planctomycetes bacterium]|nr:class I SAM-dependent methyltransferase [Planctomycetota bacterium]